MLEVNTTTLHRDNANLTFEGEASTMGMAPGQFPGEISLIGEGGVPRTFRRVRPHIGPNGDFMYVEYFAYGQDLPFAGWKLVALND